MSRLIKVAGWTNELRASVVFVHAIRSGADHHRILQRRPTAHRVFTHPGFPPSGSYATGTTCSYCRDWADIR
jgi:hypothetical protein